MRPDSPLREHDFIAFRQKVDGIRGFYNRRSEGFIPKPIEAGKFLDGEACCVQWENIFSNQHLMFAADIRELLKENKMIEPTGQAARGS